MRSHNGTWKPVAYRSRTLSEMEKCYSQIEKETVATTFGCEKFDHIVYDHKVAIETDHRPLIASICKKVISDMPPRLQRSFMQLLRYDFDLHFVPGKQLVFSDMLSRAPTNGCTVAVSTDDVEVHAISAVSSLLSDETWKCVGESINGPLKPFSSELSHVKGALFMGCQIITQSSMRQDALKRIREGHLGSLSRLLSSHELGN